MTTTLLVLIGVYALTVAVCLLRTSPAAGRTPRAPAAGENQPATLQATNGTS